MDCLGWRGFSVFDGVNYVNYLRLGPLDQVAAGQGGHGEGKEKGSEQACPSLLIFFRPSSCQRFGPGRLGPCRLISFSLNALDLRWFEF